MSEKEPLGVGVLAVQGAVEEHLIALHGAASEAGVRIDAISVRTPADLGRVHGIVLPGGESTTISRLLRSGHLQEPLLERAGHDLAVFGTCAGMILLASEAAHDVEDKDIELLRLLDASVDRNAFGRQRDSFEAEVDVAGIGAVPAVFIRAPAYDDVRGETVALASVHDRVVAAQKGWILATAFHPELTSDTRVHQHFLALAEAAASD